MPGLNDNGYIVPSRVVLYSAATDTVAPDTSLLDNPPVAWTILGHVGDETGKGSISYTRDGGTVTTKGSMTKRAIRQLVDPVISGVDVDITQFTRDVLALYIGTAGGTGVTSLQVEGQADGTATSRAMLAVFEDGVRRVGLYAPNGSWTGRDNIDTTSIADALAIPLHIGFLDSATLNGPTGKPLRYTWLSPTLLALS